MGQALARAMIAESKPSEDRLDVVEGYLHHAVLADRDGVNTLLVVTRRYDTIY